MTRRERSYMRRLLAMLDDPTRDAASARRLASVQVNLMLKMDRSRRQINELVREGVEAAEARRDGLTPPTPAGAGWRRASESNGFQSPGEIP